MILIRSLAIAALAGLALAPVAAGAAPCWSEAEQGPVHLHAFDTMLLVGALKCRFAEPDAMVQYNGFAKDRHELLARSLTQVSAHFAGIAGDPLGTAGFAGYESRLANLYSGAPDDTSGCARVGAYAQLAAHASESDLARLATALTPLEADAACPPAELAASAPVSMAARTEPPATAPVSPHVQLASAQPADQGDLVPAVVIEPPVAAVDPDKAPPAAAPAPAPQPNAAEALTAASRALALAAEAMRQQAAPAAVMQAK